MCRLRCLPLVLVVCLAALGERPAHAGEELDLAAVRAFLQDLQHAASVRDKAALQAAFDVEGILASWERLGYFRTVPEKRRAELKAVLREKIPQAVSHPAFVMPFASFEVRSIRRGEMPETFVVYVRMRHEGGGLTKTYLHLRRRGTALGLIDVEDINTGVGSTALVGTLLVEAGQGGIEGWRAAVAAIQEAQRLFQEDRYEEAFDRLEPHVRADLPDILQAMVQLLLAGTQLGLGAPEQALAYADEALSLKQDLPIVHYIRAAAWNLLGEPAHALSEARSYIAAVDADRDINLELGKALVGLGRLADARPPLRKAAEERPVDPRALAWLAVAAESEADRTVVASLHAALADPREAFSSMAEIAREARAPAALRLLTDLYAEGAPDDFRVPFFRGLAALMDGNPAAAAPLLWKAIQKQEAVDFEHEERGLYLEVWLAAMAEQGLHVPALEQAPDRAVAFRFLASDLSVAENPDGLEALVARVADDEALRPWQQYYAAEAQFLRGRYTEAVPLLRALRARVVPKMDEDEALTELVWDVEDRYIRAAVRANLDLVAVRALAHEIAKRDDDYDYLVIVLASAGEVKATLRVLAQAIENGSEPLWLFDDEDLREVLAGPAYAEARKRYLDR